MLGVECLAAESCWESLHLAKGGQIDTPLRVNTLAGISRSSVMTQVADLGDDVLQALISRDQLCSGGGGFVCGRAVEIPPLRENETCTIGSTGPGPVTEGSQQPFFDTVGEHGERFAARLDPGL